MQPRQLLREVRRRGPDGNQYVALIMDVGAVSLWNGKYLLHSEGSSQFNGVLGGSGTHRNPIVDPNIIVVEMDENTFFEILNLRVGERQLLKDAFAQEDGEIVVEADPDRGFRKPTFATLRATFRNRRIVARGKSRLEIAIVGARRDFRRKKLFVELEKPENLAFLPRYDEDGEPVFDGPLEGLREAYDPEEK